MLILHEIGCQWIRVAGIKFWQNEKSRMPRKVDVLLGQRLHIICIYFYWIKTCWLGIFPVWFSQFGPSWISGVTLFHVGSFEIMISRFHFLFQLQQLGLNKSKSYFVNKNYFNPDAVSQMPAVHHKSWCIFMNETEVKSNARLGDFKPTVTFKFCFVQ